MTSIKDLNELVLSKELTQVDIANYLNITRQSLSKIFKGEYVQISETTKFRFNNLLKNGCLHLNHAKAIIKLSKSLTSMIDDLKGVKTLEIEYLNQMLLNVKYWLEKEPRDDYMEKLNMQVQNFHMRINPFYLYFKEYFHKDLQPLLTFQVDHKQNKVYDIVLGNVVKENYLEKERDLNYQLNWNKLYDTEMDFESFIEALTNFYEGKLRYTIFEDYLDNNFKYIEENVSKKSFLKLKEINFLDISRIFQLPGDSYSIEQILENFLENIEEKKLLSDSRYRNNQIVRLIRRLCQYDVKANRSTSSIFKVVDSESYDKNRAESIQIIERRKRSDRSYERNKN